MVTTLWAASRAQLRFLKRGYAKRVRGSEAREVHEGSSGRITIWPVVLTFHPGQLPAGACSHLIALRQGAASPLLMGVCSQTTRLCRTTAQRPGSLFWELQRANGRYLRRRKPIGARTCESSFGDGHRRVPLRGCTRNRQLQQRPDVLLRGPHLGLGFVQFTTRLRAGGNWLEVQETGRCLPCPLGPPSRLRESRNEPTSTSLCLIVAGKRFCGMKLIIVSYMHARAGVHRGFCIACRKLFFVMIQEKIERIT